MTQILQRTALILLATSALVACATDPATPNYPIATAPLNVPPPVAAPAPESAPESAPAPDEAPRPRPADTITSTPLDTPTATGLPPIGATSESMPPQALPEPAAPPEPEPLPAPPAPAPPRYETVTQRSVTGKVVDVAGSPEVYTVKSGDNLDRIAKTFDMSVDELKTSNKLKDNTIHPGDKIRGPAKRAKAYVVGQGDTLFSIGRRFSVTAEALRTENDLGRNAGLKSGQRLRLPDGYRDRGAITTTNRVLVSGSEAAMVAPPAPLPTRRPTVATPAAAAPAFSDPEPAPVAEPSFRTVTNRSVTGRVITVETPGTTYTVKSGDNLDRIAKTLDMSVDELKKANKLKGNTIHPGDKLQGKGGESKAYVVNSEDTLAEVAQRFRVTPRALAAENGLSVNAKIRGGRRLLLPDGYRDRGPITTTTRIQTAPAAAAPRPAPAPAPAYTPPAYTPPPWTPPPLPPRPQPPPPVVTERPAATPPAPQPYTPPPAAFRPAPVQRPSASAAATPSAPADIVVQQMAAGRFIWPLQGEVLSDFGPKSVGQRNDGLNIRAGAGDSIRAAASGDVVYAGDQVPGFGNLVLIKHPDGWVTAYGHLSRVDVRMQQKVAQGQQIGQAGSSGGVSEPQLHFEVRYAPSPTERARPVDPKLVLPR